MSLKKVEKAQNVLLAKVSSINTESQKTPAECRLYKNPSDSEYARTIPSLLMEGKSYHKYNYYQIYSIALELLESNSYHIHIKTLCLNLGRLYYGSLRDDQKPTIHDEQAIQNDIQMRLK